MKIKLLIMLVAYFFSCQFAFADEETGLCQSQEQLIFNCKVGRKFISICASKQLMKNSGYMQYRFGEKDRIELAYPKAHDHPRGRFHLSSIGYGGGGEAHLRFINEEFEYTVFDSLKKGNQNADGDRVNILEAGLVVKKRGKIVSKLLCQDDASIHAIAYDVLESEEFKSLVP